MAAHFVSVNALMCALRRIRSTMWPSINLRCIFEFDRRGVCHFIGKRACTWTVRLAFFLRFASIRTCMEIPRYIRLAVVAYTRDPIWEYIGIQSRVRCQRCSRTIHGNIHSILAENWWRVLNCFLRTYTMRPIGGTSFLI